MILTVLGARPQFVKAAPMSAALAEAGLEEAILHTGQHYDHNMSQSFFDDLGIPAPKHHLGIGSAPHGRQTGAMMDGIERVCLEERPGAILVFGDTNSTLAAALVAAKLDIPTAHVEAGLRSYNRQMPEEINRVLTDHVSRWLFCPTEHSAANLAKEGVAEGIHVVGDIMFDVLRQTLDRHTDTPSPAAALGIEPPYLAATIHRPENTDSPDNLREILGGFSRIGLPVVLPLHPRTRALLPGIGADPADLAGSGVHVIEPLGYPDMLKLVADAHAVFTDSGGLQKEAYWLETPCRTIRKQTEWIETIETGWNQLVPANADAIEAAATDIERPNSHPPVYGDGSTAPRIAEILADNQAS